MSSPKPDALQVSILGLPVISWCGESLSIPRRQARALFYRMAASLQMIPREQFCFLLWPDSSDREAKRHLSHMLTHIRRAIPISDLLITNQDAIGLNPHKIWSDAREFIAQIVPIGSLTQENDRAASLESVLNLYRGPFLSGFSSPDCPEFETWLAQERQAYKTLYLERLIILVDIYRQRKEYPRAIACARRYLETDELAEDIHRALMSLYAAEGDLSAVQRQFERCTVVLERELRVSPLPETWEVYKSALAGRASALPKPALQAGVKFQHRMEMPVVGREDTLDQLEMAARHAFSGCPRLVFLSGEPGIGKTRLMKEFRIQHQEKVEVLSAACYPGTPNLPYQLVAELLRPALISHAADLKDQQVWLAEASRLFPEISSLFPDLPAPLPARGEEARTRLFEALSQLVFCLASGPRPIFLCLDDLHWADSLTLEWLAYLGQRLASSPDVRLLILAAYRSEEGSRLAPILQALDLTGIYSQYVLNKLTLVDVYELFCQFKGSRTTSYPIAARLHEISGGNPFFLMEILHSFAETGQYPEDPGDLERTPLPETIHAAVLRRLERLSARERQVLEAAAVLGLSFSFEALQKTAGRSELETLESLDVLASRHLLAERESGYQFTHHLIQTSIYKDFSNWHLRLLHRRAGEALETLSPKPITELAWHFEQAGQPAKAARYALQAGIDALELFADAAARKFFDRALSLLKKELEITSDPSIIRDSQELQIRVLTWRSRVLRLVGDMQTYWQDLREEFKLVRLLKDQPGLADLYLREATACTWSCQYARASQSALNALHLGEELADQLIEGRAYREIGLVARSSGDFEKAQSALEMAYQLFIQTGQTQLEIHTLGNLSTLFLRAGNAVQALEVARRAMARCEESGATFDRRIPLGDIGAAAACLGDRDTAQAGLLESLKIAQQIGDRTQEIFCRGHLGWLEIQCRRVDRAMLHLQAGLDLAERINSCQELAWLHNGLAEASLYAGDLAAARMHANQALQLGQANSDRIDEELARAFLAKL